MSTLNAALILVSVWAVVLVATGLWIGLTYVGEWWARRRAERRRERLQLVVTRSRTPGFRDPLARLHPDRRRDYPRPFSVPPRGAA